ncbi:MAG: 30S ribosomal protein S27ae [Candidatus Aenigmatarchaeota archaeon]
MAKEVKKTVEAMAPQEARAEAAAAKEEKKKEKRSQKERPRSKKKHTKVQVWKLYKVEGSKLVRKNESCPRCGPGAFLAVCQNRKYCGKCGYGIVQQPMK